MKYTLTKDNLKSIAVGALMAAGGALLTYFNAVVMATDFTYGGADYTPVVVALWSIILNTARKYVSE